MCSHRHRVSYTGAVWTLSFFDLTVLASPPSPSRWLPRPTLAISISSGARDRSAPYLLRLAVQFEGPGWELNPDARQTRCTESAVRLPSQGDDISVVVSTVTVMDSENFQSVIESGGSALPAKATTCRALPTVTVMDFEIFRSVIGGWCLDSEIFPHPLSHFILLQAPARRDLEKFQPPPVSICDQHCVTGQHPSITDGVAIGRANLPEPSMLGGDTRSLYRAPTAAGQASATDRRAIIETSELGKCPSKADKSPSQKA